MWVPNIERLRECYHFYTFFLKEWQEQLILFFKYCDTLILVYMRKSSAQRPCILLHTSHLSSATLHFVIGARFSLDQSGSTIISTTLEIEFVASIIQWVPRSWKLLKLQLCVSLGAELLRRTQETLGWVPVWKILYSMSCMLQDF